VITLSAPDPVGLVALALTGRIATVGVGLVFVSAALPSCAIAPCCPA
jgi:hypothetical protein